MQTCLRFLSFRAFGFALLVAILGTGASASAQIFGIGVQFQGFGAEPFAATDAAGEIPLSHWNVDTSTTGARSTALALLNSTGVSSGVSLTYGTPTAATVFHGQGWLGAGVRGSADQNLYSGTLTTSTSLTFSLTGINYATYDLLVYVTGNSTSGSPVTYASGNGSMAVGGTTYYFTTPGVVMPTSGGFVQATSTTAGSPTVGGNYVLFTGLSGSDLSFTLNKIGSNGNPGVAGFQIIDTAAVPEPGTVALIALGGAVVLLRLRRRSVEA